MEVDFGVAMFANFKSLFVSFLFKTPQTEVSKFEVKLKNTFHYKIHYAKALNLLKGQTSQLSAGLSPSFFRQPRVWGR